MSRAEKMSTDSQQTLPEIHQLKAIRFNRILLKLVKPKQALNKIRLQLQTPNQSRLLALILFMVHLDLEGAKIKTLPMRNSDSWTSSETACQLKPRLIQKSMMTLRKVSARLRVSLVSLLEIQMHIKNLGGTSTLTLRGMMVLIPEKK